MSDAIPRATDARGAVLALGRWLWRLGLFALLALLLFLELPAQHLRGGELGRLSELGGDPPEPGALLAQYRALDGVVVPAAHRLDLDLHAADGGVVHAAGRVRLSRGGAGRLPGSTVAYLELCEDAGRSTALRLSTRDGVPSALLAGGQADGGQRDAAATARAAGWQQAAEDAPTAGWALALSREGRQQRLSIDGTAIALPRCTQPAARLWVSPGAGSAELTGWHREVDGRSQAVAPAPASRLLHLVAALLLAVLLVLATELLRRRFPPLRLARRMLGLLWRGGAACWRWIDRRPATRIAASVLAVVMPPLVVAVDADPGATWRHIAEGPVEARQGHPARLIGGLPENLTLTATQASDEGADCHLAFRDRRVPLQASFTEASIVYTSWVSVPLDGGEFSVRDPEPAAATGPSPGTAITLQVAGSTATLAHGDEIRTRQANLPRQPGALWLVSRGGTCRLDGLRVEAGRPAGVGRYAGFIVWCGGLLLLWCLLRLAGVERRMAARSLLGAAGVAALGLAVAGKLLGLRWPALALGLAATAIVQRRLLDHSTALRRTLGPALLVLGLVMLDLGLGGLAPLQRARDTARIPPADFLLYHQPIGSYDWHRFAELAWYGGYAYGAKAPDQRRVLCLGGSSTQGSGASSPQRAYPPQLERRLNAARPAQPVQVINAGQYNYTSLNLRLLAERELHDLDPDLVVLDLGFNDCTRLLQPRTQYRAPARERGPLSRMLERSSLWLLFRDTVLSAYRYTTAGLDGVFGTQGIPPDDFRANLTRIASLVQAQGGRVLLVQEPRIQRLASEGPDACEPYRDAMSDVATDLGLPLVDPLAQWGPAQAPALFVDAVHLDDRGYAALADLLAGAIAKRGLLAPAEGAR